VREIVPKAPRQPRAGKVLMNVHGGAYWLMGGRLCVNEGLGMADVGRYRVVSVDYRMPPEHPFPAAVEDGVAVYRKLLESYEAENIAIFGTSAGGGLAAAVTLAARDAGLPMPAAVIMHTPWADLSKTGDSYFTNDRVDPTIPTYDGALEAAAKLYAGDAGLKHPLVSPVYADYAPGFPPALLSTGTRDLLLSPTVRLHRALRRGGIPAELHVFDAMWHGLNRMPEALELQKEVLAFLSEHLGD
jgi:acetyl esterase/lipase